jgi:hypothetical protein
MGTHQVSSKTSYYKLMKKEIKKSYENIISNEFNRDYSLKVSKFSSDKKKKQHYNIEEGEIIDWKLYLLNKFYPKNSKGWKNTLFDFIRNEHEYKVQNYEIYFLQNEIFMSQFSLLINPGLYMKSRNENVNPILFLFSPEELKEYSEKTKKNKKNKKNDDDIIYNVNKNYENENEDNNEQNDILIEFQDKDEEKQRPKSKSLKLFNTMQGLYTHDNFKASYLKSKNEINSYKIREHITLIRSQLDNDNHPISKIIKKFSESYISILKKRYESAKESKNTTQINEIKGEIIKDIQSFVEIISVGLKLFYSKTINYESFISERDEFINLICFFLFKDDNFYINLFKFFELSNEEKRNNFRVKKLDLGALSPEDFDVSPQFCLNNITKNIKEKKSYNNNIILNKKKKKAEIVDYFEKLDINQEIFNNSVFNDSYCFEGFQNINKMDKNEKNNRFKSFHDGKTEIKSKRNRKKLFKDDNSIDPSKSISSYKDFSDTFNSLNETLIEKYESEMKDNPSKLNIPKLENLDKIDENSPYAEEIKYIQTIKDYNVPLDKLTIIALTSVLITDDVDNYWKGEKGLKEYLTITADDLMSIYLYIVYNMDLPSIYTELDFIKYFTGSTTKQSMIGYYYTTIEGCLTFIMDAKTKEDFKKK